MIPTTAELVTAADWRALPLSDAKVHLGEASDVHDVEIASLIDAATELLETMTGTVVRQSTWLLSLPCFPSGDSQNRVIWIPKPPCQSVTSVQYYDTDGANQTWDSAEYYVLLRHRIPSLIQPALGYYFPSTQSNRLDAVRVTFVTGYPQGSVPDLVQTFIKLVIRHWYDNPSAVITGRTATELPYAATSIARAIDAGLYADV